MLVWLSWTIRPTRDADLLGFGEVSQESLARIFTDVCGAFDYLCKPIDVDALVYAVALATVLYLKVIKDQMSRKHP